MADRTMTDIALDEKALEALARAYDKEDAAQRGEPDPWQQPDWSGWEEERLACARAGMEAYRRSSPSQVAPANPAQGVSEEAVKAATKQITLAMQMYDFGRSRNGDFTCSAAQIDLLEQRAEVAARAVVAAIGAGGQAVAVKPLEWNPFSAETPFGYYHIDDQTDRSADELKGRPPFLLSGSRIDLSRHSTLEAAKAAAQADHERRIFSVLSQPYPADERVVGALREAYEKVKLWPENRMPGVDVTELGEGFTDLLALRNLIPDVLAVLSATEGRKNG